MSALAALLALILAAPPAGPEAGPSVSLDEAIQLALARDYELRRRRLDVQSAEERQREAWRATAFPRVDATASYTRHFEAPNPFAGTDAQQIFGGGGAAASWVAFNEAARTDDDPATEPLPLDQFLALQQQGRDAAGVEVADPDDNPFLVPNQFFFGLTLRQVIYEPAAFAAITAADRFPSQKMAEERRQAQIVVDEVSRAYYAALLAQSRAEVLQKSVERARATLEEARRRVEQGVAPRFQELSAEVELTNLETSHLQSANAALLAIDAVKFAIGVPVGRPLRLRGDLEVEKPLDPEAQSLEEATKVALARRPDLEAARIGVELLSIQVERVEANYLPSLHLIGRAGYQGNVPDDRTRVVTDPSDPFAFRVREESFFSDAYWYPNLSLGVELTWNLFEGLAGAPRVAQAEIDVTGARVSVEQLEQGIALEVERARRDLADALRRLGAQQRNIERAELNYEHTRIRVNEGVSTPLELRDASEQLDQARLNRLQALYDYHVARARYEVALGTPVEGGEP